MNALSPIAATVATASLDYPAFKLAMTNACKVADRRGAPLVTACVLIAAARNGAKVTATDLDLFTTSFVAGEVDPDFVAVVQAHKLKAVMDKVKDAARINLARDGDTLTVSIGKLRLDLCQPVPADDFPVADPFRVALGQSNCAFLLPTTALTTMLRKVAFAVSTEETRYYLNGIYMHVDEHAAKLVFAATDGHRLSRYQLSIPAGAGAMSDGVIIPLKTVAELQRLVNRKGCPDQVLVTTTKTGISFLIGEDELLESKVIDGTFADYGRVIPVRNPLKVGIPAAKLMDAARQASAILTERAKGMRLSFTAGHLALGCEDAEFGRASTEIQVTSGFELTFGVNCRYLLDILERLDGGAMFELADRSSPMVIRDGGDEQATFVLMPLRV